MSKQATSDLSPRLTTLDSNLYDERYEYHQDEDEIVFEPSGVRFKLPRKFPDLPRWGEYKEALLFFESLDIGGFFHGDRFWHITCGLIEPAAQVKLALKKSD